MSRYLKERIVEEYAQRFDGVAHVAVVNTEGIDANRMVVFRKTLRDRGVQAMRIQNRLCRLAIQDGSLAGLEALLDGPTTLVWGGESIVDIAKVLAEEAEEIQSLDVRGGFSAGQVLSREQVQDLSKLPGREELIGQVVARAVGQAGRVVSLATAPASGLLAQIREIEKREPAEAEAPDGKAETPEATEAETQQPPPGTDAESAEAPDAAAGDEDAAPGGEQDEPTPDADARPADEGSGPEAEPADDQTEET